MLLHRAECGFLGVSQLLQVLFDDEITMVDGQAVDVIASRPFTKVRSAAS